MPTAPLTVAGARWEDRLYSAGSYGIYWSSTHFHDGTETHYAHDLRFDSDFVRWFGDRRIRSYGQSVRPVSR